MQIDVIFLDIASPIKPSYIYPVLVLGDKCSLLMHRFTDFVALAISVSCLA